MPVFSNANGLSGNCTGYNKIINKYCLYQGMQAHLIPSALLIMDALELKDRLGIPVGKARVENWRQSRPLNPTLLNHLERPIAYRTGHHHAGYLFLDGTQSMHLYHSCCNFLATNNGKNSGSACRFTQILSRDVVTQPSQIFQSTITG